MNNKRLHFGATLRGAAALPASKSLSARALVCAALCGGVGVKNLSTSDDTQALQRALGAQGSVVDIGPAGTAMRFATAVFSLRSGRRMLTGSERMLHRPIGLLVDALRSLGACIAYVGEEGFPPLRIEGTRLRGGEVSLRGDVSSQYVSALLMIAPCLQGGLTLRLTGSIGSRPYIDMTLAVMHFYGVEARWEDAQTLRVEQGAYAAGRPFVVENDWSAASYWYELVALSPDAEARIVLNGLHRDSLQGDARVAEMFVPLGVKTDFTAEGIVLSKTAPSQGLLQIDFSAQPDLAQTLVATCVGLRRPFRFTGLQSLRIKETDRTAALQAELLKVGGRLVSEGDAVLTYDGTLQGLVAEEISMKTYADHRMAMALAPLAYLHPGLQIEDPGVVTKSYPGFWKEIERYCL